MVTFHVYFEQFNAVYCRIPRHFDLLLLRLEVLELALFR